jgi:hypothetical protein
MITDWKIWLGGDAQGIFHRHLTDNLVSICYRYRIQCSEVYQLA